MYDTLTLSDVFRLLFSILEISTNKKRLLTVVLLPSYTTILKSLILIRPFISLNKNGEGLLIVVCVKVAVNRLLLLGKLQDGFTVLLMTETKLGIILTLKNNTNPFELLGNCRSCQENWMNRGHEKTRLCLEHENKITFYLLFHCS